MAFHEAVIINDSNGQSGIIIMRKVFGYLVSVFERYHKISRIVKVEASRLSIIIIII